jgi:uncharacterized protein YegP (UPF0339 family)
MYFVIYKSKPGAYWWVIKSSGNHETLANSEILGSKAGCLHAIGIVKANATNAQIIDSTGEA